MRFVSQVRKALLVLLLALSLSDAHAALTQAQLREHLGAMVSRGVMQSLRQGVPLEEITLVDMLSWAKDYRANGTLGTQAERTEAMQTLYRQLFQRVTGLDPVNGSANDIHYYKKHWLLQHVGKDESDTVEP